jgi:hypothetical protein
MLPEEGSSDARFVERVRSTPFIFVGRIVKRGAATMDIEPGDRTAVVVVVDTVLRAPAVLGRLERKRITVLLAAGKPARPGLRALFYATSWLYGDGIAVVEVAREAAPRDAATALARVARAELAIEDARLAERLRHADLVILGSVLETAPIGRELRGPRSEHDPVWWRAELVVDAVEKGRLKQPQLSVFFPSSLDEYWLDVPKLQPSQRGVFLLHRGGEGKRNRFPPPGLAMLDPLDSHPPTQHERIRALLKLIAA